MFGNQTFDDADITLDGLTSYISVDALKENFGTYTCYVKNRMGDGIPCEIKVTGIYPSQYLNRWIVIFSS